MTAHRIIRIPILPFGMVNAYLVFGARGCILVDAGLPGSEAKVDMALSRYGLTYRDIKLIVVTHAHIDHAGNAARLRDLSGAPIAGHKGDNPHFKREVPMTFCPTGWAGRLFMKAPLIHEPYRAFEPDILLSGNDAIDLSAYGVDGILEPTIGHTAGSISIKLSSGEALVGDLIASGILIGGLIRTGHPIRPPFEDDPHAVAGHLCRLLDSKMETFYMGHGGPLEAKAVRRHIRALQRLPVRR